MPDNFIETLEPLLRKSGDDAYNLFELHGFLTGVAISPQLLNPGLWISRVFGPSGKMPVYEDPKDAERVTHDIMEFYHSILDALDACAFVPVMPVDEKDGSAVKDPVPWCRGFVDGLLLWAGKRFKDKDSDFAKLLMPVMYFAEPSIFEPMKKEMSASEISELETLWIEMIPKLVAAIQQYVKNEPAEPLTDPA